MSKDSTDSDIKVVRDDDAERYEIVVDGQLAGFTMFHTDRRGRRAFPHTVIDPDFRGQGLAKQLIAEAMADAASRGETVVPYCSAVAKYLRKHDVPGLAVHWPRLSEDGKADAEGGAG